jgi:hypothetical protein
VHSHFSDRYCRSSDFLLLAFRRAAHAYPSHFGFSLILCGTLLLDEDRQLAVLQKMRARPGISAVDVQFAEGSWLISARGRGSRNCPGCGLKHAMYGRANIELLRARMLPL